MADYLTDEEQADRLKRWWDNNGTSLIVGLALAVGGVVGWRYYQTYATDQAGAASEVFSAYLEARAAAEPTIEHLTVLDDDHAGSTYHVFSLLYRATDQTEEKDWEEALAFLERAVELADAAEIRDIARYRAAKVLYQLDRLDECEAELAQIRSVGLEAHVAELSGDVYLARGDAEAARQAYQAALDAARRDPKNQPPGLEFMELKLASVVDSEA